MQCNAALARVAIAACALALPAASAGDARADPGPPAAAASAVTASRHFDLTLALQGVSFRVTSANDSSVNRLEIVPAGLALDNRPITRTIDGSVVGAEVADLDADGSPEIYVYVSSAGSGSYGSLVAYAANRRKSLSEIHLPPIAGDARIAGGYQGHDRFAVGEGALLRRFPVYRPGDPNAAPSGGMRQIQYKLARGEASWRLRIDRIVEF